MIGVWQGLNQHKQNADDFSWYWKKRKDGFIQNFKWWVMKYITLQGNKTI